MNRSLLALLIVTAGFCHAEDKGTCPPAPPNVHVRKDKIKVSNKGQGSVGSVTLLTVISDTGYVCSTQMVHGLGDPNFDNEAVNAVKKWHFTPAEKNGRPVPVVVTINVTFRVDKDGKPVITSSPPEPQASNSANAKP